MCFQCLFLNSLHHASYFDIVPPGFPRKRLTSLNSISRSDPSSPQVRVHFQRHKELKYIRSDVHLGNLVGAPTHRPFQTISNLCFKWLNCSGPTVFS